MKSELCNMCNIRKSAVEDFITGVCACSHCSKYLFEHPAHLYFGHVRERVMERFSIDFDSSKYGFVIDQIRNGRSVFVARTCKNTSIQIVEVDGKRIPFVFRGSKGKGSKPYLKTALPNKFYVTSIDGNKFSMTV